MVISCESSTFFVIEIGGIPLILLIIFGLQFTLGDIYVQAAMGLILDMLDRAHQLPSPAKLFF